MPKPDQAEVSNFLDALRESGATNMFGAVPYVMDMFSGLTKREATEMWATWAREFRGGKA